MNKIILVFLCIASIQLGFAQSNREFKLLTLNCWFLSILGHDIGKDIDARLMIIPEKIVSLDADIILLQEVWSNKHKKYLAKTFKEFGYSYIHYEKRRLNMGDGLMIISKFPITSTDTSSSFSVATKFEEVFTSKRLIYAEVELPSKERIDILTTHVGALGYDEKIGSYKIKQKARQNIQYQEIKEFTQEVHTNNKLILAGDFNAHYLEFKHGKFENSYSKDYLNLIKNGCGNDDFTNVFMLANKMNADSSHLPTYAQENPYVASGAFANSPSEVEDFVFACGYEEDDISKSKIVFDTQNDIISDHYGIISTFKY
jgi:endonuclease/exonuclease/phosphatase family metal-dependent hydrolase